MVNALRVDFYRVFKSKAFYICTALTIAFAAMSLFVTNLMYMEAKQANYDELTLELFGIPNLSVVGMLPLAFADIDSLIVVIIPISLFITLDFSVGTIKNYASKGVDRSYLYLSKLLVSLFVAFAIVIANILTCIIISLALWGVGTVPQNFALDLMRMLGLEFLTYAAVSSLFVMIAFLIRSKAGTISASLCTLFFSSIILSLISLLIEKVFKSDFIINDYWVFDYFTKLASYSLDSNLVTRSLIVNIVFIALTTFIGIWSFKKRDIK